MIKKVIPFVHSIVKENITENDCVIDMTMGNGNDTLFLSQLSKKVYAFDIQEEAIKATEKLLDKNKVNNVVLVHDSHINVLNYINEQVSIVVFNLGYLPGGDKSISTTYKDTIKAIENVLSILKQNGFIILTVYPGHKEGKIESDHLLDYVHSFSSKDYNVITYQFINKNNSPYNIIIEKN
jgi:tRNA G37 N-methylase Trm5